MADLNPLTIQIYNFIVEFFADRTYPPSPKEVAEGLNIKPSTAYYHMFKLKQLGYIRYPRHSSRAIELTAKKPE